ncbi:MAG TPA: guanylate kinase, partial [Anaerolineales bacterium]|nr:guanylate kinase [Anaerolineales bacterium]
TIFIAPASEAELVDRLRERKTETPEGLQLRIATARQELARMKEFDYFVINRDEALEEAVDTILAIIAAEHSRVQPRRVQL